MGLEHLIAALGATWFVNRQEKRRLRQAEKEEAVLQELLKEQQRVEEEKNEKQQSDKNWRKHSFNDYHVDPNRYETEEKYEVALQKKKEKFETYRDVMDVLNAHDGINLHFLVLRVETLEKLLEERPSYVPDDIYFYLLYLRYCVPFTGETKSLMEVEYFEVMKVLAKQNNCDMDEILEKAEMGTLLPKGAKLLRNYYLSTYILTNEKVPWTLYLSSYYYRNFGFTLEEFSKCCGDSPDYYFHPPIKGIEK